MKGSLVPCGHTFSDFQIYDEKTAKEECIKMVRNIMEYWKAEAASCLLYTSPSPRDS